MMATCMQCGAENSDDRQACDTCGALLTAEQEKGPVGSLPPGPVTRSPDAQQKVPPEEPAPSMPSQFPPPPPLREMPPVVGVPYGYGSPIPQQQSQLGLWSMISGISSIVFHCCCGIVGTALAIVAIVLGMMARKDQTANQQMATAGIVTGAVSLVLFGATIVFYIVMLVMGKSGSPFLPFPFER